jgi:hypothetical protein
LFSFSQTLLGNSSLHYTYNVARETKIARSLVDAEFPVDRSAAYAADVQVMISAGFYSVYAELGPAFEHASAHHLITTRSREFLGKAGAAPVR